jgi:hypothetical protein
LLSLFLFFSFFHFVRYLAPRPAKTALPILTIYTSNDAVSRKEVPFGGTNASKNFQGVHFPPKTPKVGPGIGISSLNRTINNFSTVDAIFAQNSSLAKDIPNFQRNEKNLGLAVFFWGNTPRKGHQAKTRC